MEISLFLIRQIVRSIHDSVESNKVTIEVKIGSDRSLSLISEIFNNPELRAQFDDTVKGYKNPLNIRLVYKSFQPPSLIAFIENRQLVNVSALTIPVQTIFSKMPKNAKAELMHLDFSSLEEV